MEQGWISLTPLRIDLTYEDGCWRRERGIRWTKPLPLPSLRRSLHQRRRSRSARTRRAIRSKRPHASPSGWSRRWVTPRTGARPDGWKAYPHPCVSRSAMRIADHGRSSLAPGRQRSVFLLRENVKIVLIHNPTAGDGDHDEAKLTRLVAKFGDVTYQSVKTKGWARVFETTPADLIVAAGGDGLVRRVALNAPRGSRIGILPLGTANNVANSLGIAGRPKEIIAGWKDRRAAARSRLGQGPMGRSPLSRGHRRRCGDERSCADGR